MELLFELMASAVTKFVHKNRAGLQNDKLVQYANILQSANAISRKEHPIAL